jgi:prepilin-type N-terminal cleavage/methylation domain-containing protein
MKKGFTLLELMVVVIVIAILSVIAVPVYTLTVEKSKATELVKLTRSIYDSVERYTFRHPEFNDVVYFKNLDIDLRGVAQDGGEDDETTRVYNGYSFLEINAGDIRATRAVDDTGTAPSSGQYFISIPRSGNNAGNMYCHAQTGTDAVKICAGISSSTAAPQAADGFTVFKM